MLDLSSRLAKFRRFQFAIDRLKVTTGFVHRIVPTSPPALKWVVVNSNLSSWGELSRPRNSGDPGAPSLKIVGMKIESTLSVIFVTIPPINWYPWQKVLWQIRTPQKMTSQPFHQVRCPPLRNSPSVFHTRPIVNKYWYLLALSHHPGGKYSI